MTGVFLGTLSVGVHLHRLLREKSLWLSTPLAFWCFCVILLVFSNLALLVGVDLGVSGPLVVGVLFLSALICYRVTEPIGLESQQGRAFSIFLLVGTGIVFAFTSASQNLHQDDDYWIHTPLQALISKNGLPILHPFFSNIEMHGHYGRDLLVAATSGLGSDIFYSQAWLGALCQACSFLLYCLVPFHLGSTRLQAALCGTFVFFGINVGNRGGLLDTFQNNNPLVYLYLIALLYLYARFESQPGPWKALLVGTALGSYALVYETHYGLLVLTWLFLSLLTPSGGQASRRKFSVLVLGTSFMMALLQGGPLTHLWRSYATSVRPVSEYSPGELNQHQIVKLRFPKKELFCLQLGHGSYQRISCGYEAIPWLRSKVSVEPGTPYRSIWSKDVLILHWLPLMFAPLTFFLMFYIRSIAGRPMVVFGALAYLVPSLVDFGPIYEFEYYRWQVASGVAFAGSLGLAVGWLWESSRKSKPLWLVASALALGVLGVNTIGCTRIFVPRLLEQLQLHPNRWSLLLPLPTESWLKLQSSALGFYAADFQVAEYLANNAEPGDSLLVNFPEFGNESILMESTMVGLTGVRSVGHKLPLPEDPIGTPPYRMSPMARSYWSSREPSVLKQENVDWVYERRASFPRRPSPSLKLALKANDGGREHSLLYRVNRSVTPEPSVSKSDLRVLRLEFVSQLTTVSGRCVPLKITLANPLENDLFLSSVVSLAEGTVNPYDHVPFRAKRGSRVVDGWLVTPQNKAPHAIRLFVETDGHWIPLSTPSHRRIQVQHFGNEPRDYVEVPRPRKVNTPDI